VDRFDIKKSKRVDEDGEHLWVNPAAYQEDWKLIGEEVILKSYELADGSGRRMSVKLVMCDSGGREGVTTNAYKFVRWLRWGDKGLPVEQIEQEGGDTLAQAQQGTYEWVPGMAGRFMLVKGSALKNAPRVKIDYPDSQRKDRHAGARGEIPVAFINVNSIKDTVNNMLDRTDPGGRIYFPNWLDDSFYAELTVEVKSPSKGWINPKNFRNESWDLLAYCVAATLLPTINLERMDPEEPPSWAAEWDHNDLVFSIEEKTKPFEPKKTDLDNLADLAGKLA
jgi:phage terminase large subunit GpA-like protein